MKLYIVRKTNKQDSNSTGFVLSNEEPYSVLGKLFFPGDKFQLASLTTDARGDGNVITDADAIMYLKSLKRGDAIEWCEPTEKPVEFFGKAGEEIKLKRLWLKPVEDKLIDAIDAYVDSLEPEAPKEETKKPNRKPAKA